MLSSLEFLHYCRRFQNQLFSFCFFSAEHCRLLLMDLRVLHAARIRNVVFTPYDENLMRSFQTWIEAGDDFILIHLRDGDDVSDSVVGSVSAALDRGQVPVVFVEFGEAVCDRDIRLQRDVFMLSELLGAKKMFFSIQDEGLRFGDALQSYPTPESVRHALSEGVALNMPASRLEVLLCEQERTGIDVVLVGAREGSVFEEVFTHAGSGTLFSREYTNELRPAEAKDLRELMAIMTPQIADGSLTAMSEDKLLELMPSFWVYTVNSQVVAGAALIEFGDASELSKLCTLPRYQAKGRARAVVEALLEKAQGEGRRYVFALTVQDYVGKFFERIGFVRVARDELPEAWKAQYDLTRPSKAYRYAFPGQVN